MTSLDPELERLRAENARLDEQIKLLVQTEQRLYRTQNAREHELRRIRAIGAFASEEVGKPVADIVVATLAMLHECFSLAAAVVVTVGDDGGARVDGDGGPRAAPLPAPAAALLAELTSATIVPLERADDHARPVAATRELLAALGVAAGGSCALIPLGHRRTAIAVGQAPRRPVYRADPLGEGHRPLVVLIGNLVARILEHAALTEDLRRRSRSLAEVNQQLAASLHTLERTQAELIQAGKMEAIGRLAGGVAHDFNNLLTVILSHAALAADQLPVGSPVASDLADVLAAGRRAAEITGQLLALGRKTVQRREHVDVGRVARELARVLKGLLGRAVDLEVIAEPDCGVFADRAQLEQILLNLVVNARDAMRDGGTVRVAVRVARPEDVAHLAPAGGGSPWIAIEVADTGHGIDEATRTRIFEPFFTTKEAGRGTGLGLSVVYGIVTQSEGTITVDSQPAGGTRFLILLPRRRAPAVAEAGVDEPSSRAARILVVEDNDAIRRVMVRLLERAGHRVVEAGDGVDALARFDERGGAFDLVITDLDMPRLGGLELARRLRARAPATRILFMTGYSDELAELSRQAPTEACMTKPFTPDQLLQHVGRELARGGPPGPGAG